MKYTQQMLQLPVLFSINPAAELTPYCEGHREAREMAAQLAADADARISDLEEALRCILSSTAVLNHMDADEHGKYCDLVSNKN